MNELLFPSSKSLYIQRAMRAYWLMTGEYPKAFYVHLSEEHKYPVSVAHPAVSPHALRLLSQMSPDDFKLIALEHIYIPRKGLGTSIDNEVYFKLVNGSYWSAGDLLKLRKENETYVNIPEMSE